MVRMDWKTGDSNTEISVFRSSFTCADGINNGIRCFLKINKKISNNFSVLNFYIQCTLKILTTRSWKTLHKFCEKNFNSGRVLIKKTIKEAEEDCGGRCSETNLN